MEYSSRQQIKRLFELFPEEKRAYVLLLIFRGIMESSIAIVTTLLLTSIIDAVTSKNMHELVRVCMQFSIVIAAMCVLTPLSKYWFGKIVRTITLHIRLRIFRHMLNIQVSYYEKTHSGDSLSRITSDLGTMEGAYASQFSTVVNLLIMGIGSTAVMIYLDWRFTIAMIVLGALTTYINTRFARPMRKISTEIQKKNGTQLERLSNLIAGTQVSRMFQMQSFINRKFSESTRELADLSLERVKLSAKISSVNYLLLWFNNGGVFTIGALMLIKGQITIGNLLGTVLLLEGVTTVFRNLGIFWTELQAKLAGADRVYEFLDIAEEPTRLPETTVERSNDEVRGFIDFRNVYFSYCDEENVLQRISFSIGEGQMAAFVGPSGGGKSTILKLIHAFYPLKEGEIWLDGKQISDFMLERVRDMMAYVSQDTYLFSGTIEENICYGKLDATTEEVIEAAKAAYAHDFIMEQPDGYGTFVGERGARLSGGQKQRIAIARAILKNAPILLLDEATSALDSESEQAVQRGIDRLVKGKTTLAIAHRLSTIQQADMIYVIDNGSIVEQGTHAELLRAGGLYSRMNDMSGDHLEGKRSL